MRILVVTAFQQLRPDAVSGFAMRQRLFIEAMTRLGAELHIYILLTMMQAMAADQKHLLNLKI
ncbi:MAG: hypothetical protein IPP57_28005 [Candidatus Obscuribacter sp.]|nr:hypothetical protein [Candidatus Obscuribacter sp.]